MLLNSCVMHNGLSLLSATETFYADAGDALAQFADLTHIPIFSNMWSRGLY